MTLVSDVLRCPVETFSNPPWLWCSPRLVTQCRIQSSSTFLWRPDWRVFLVTRRTVLWCDNLSPTSPIGRLAMLPSSHWSLFLFHNHVNQNNSCISRYHLESDQKRVSLIYGNSQKALPIVPHTHVTGLPFLRQKLIKTDLQVF